jgi:uncharacterized protein involved in cysteine biosynthesis
VSRVAGRLGAAAWAFALPWTALRLLVRERRLWALAALPLILSAGAALAAASAVVAQAGSIYAFARGLFPSPEAAVWWAWLWVGPLRALFFLLEALVFAGIAALAVAAAFVLASLLGSPFHDALSRRVEQLLTGCVQELHEPGLRGALRAAGRALREESRRLLFFAAVWLSIAAVGLLVPGAQLVAGPALALVSLLMLTLDAAGYTLDRRGLRFADKRRWVGRHPAEVLGFGLAALLVCAVPGVNLLALPVLVVAGTLLALRTEPSRPGLRSPGGDAGTPTSP